MKILRLSILSILVLCNSKVSAQDIKPKDLIGKWVIQDERKWIDFLDSTNLILYDSTICYSNSIKFISHKGTYEIGIEKSESLLTLNIDSANQIISKRAYLIRRHSPDEYYLQLLKTGKDGTIESYDWNEKNKVCLLFRMVMLNATMY